VPLRENVSGENHPGNRSMIRKPLLRATLLLLLATLPLHAGAKTPKGTLAAPAAEGPTQVAFSTKAVSKWTDLPLGTYRVPNSDVIISGHQKSGAGVLFGVVGVAIQNSVQKSNGKEALASAEQALTLSIDEEANALLQAAMADPAYAGKFSAAPTPGRTYEVTGAVVMSFASAQDALPYVVLRVKLLDGGGSKLWTTRYIASSGPRRPLVGDGSWTVEEGAMLRTHVSGLLKTAIDTMLRDIATPYPRDEASLVTVRGWFPHVNKPLEVVGYKLAEADGRLLFLPKLGTTIVFAGVNSLDTATMAVTPFAKGDKPLKLLKPTDPRLPTNAAIAATAAAPATASDLPVAATPEASADASASVPTDAALPAETGEGEVDADADAAEAAESGA
jgi:hypothetical protein